MMILLLDHSWEGGVVYDHYRMCREVHTRSVDLRLLDGGSVS